VRMLWAYAYQMVPPQPASRLGTLRTLLQDETVGARGGDRTWSGRLVLERRATHILIVSDGPGRNHSINRRLEAELERLGAPFSVTEPLVVAGPAEGVQVPVSSNGNGR
jgi:hypothetical protein